MKRKAQNSSERIYKGYKVIRQHVGNFGWNIAYPDGDVFFTGADTMDEVESIVDDMINFQKSFE